MSSQVGKTTRLGTEAADRKWCVDSRWPLEPLNSMLVSRDVGDYGEVIPLDEARLQLVKYRGFAL